MFIILEDWKEAGTLSVQLEILFKQPRVAPALGGVLYHPVLGKSLTETVSNLSVLFVSLCKTEN